MNNNAKRLTGEEIRQRYETDVRPDRAAVRREMRRVRRQRRRNRRRAIRLAWLVAALAIGFLTAGQLALVVVVQGNSMSPTLENGNAVLCLRGDWLKLPPPARGETVLMGFEGALLVKRVIAVGGDEVLIDEDGALFVNGQAVQEAYASAPASGSDVVYPLTVPEGELFVMGDHRSFAVDSRSRVFGTVPQESVAGRPLAVVWPVFDCAWLGWPGRDAASGFSMDEALE